MKNSDLHEFDDLEPLSASPTPMAGGLAELPDDVHEHSGASAASAGAAAAARAPAGAKRELDRAPLELRKASLFILAGSIFPWANPLNFAVGPTVEKLICYLAVWIVFQAHVLKHTGKANGLVMGLGKKSPLVPLIVAGVIAIVGITPVATAGTAATGGFWELGLGRIMEKVFLLLSGYTLAHIYDYEHGGKFNPIFPLLFLFPAIAGFASIFTKIVPVFGEMPAAAGVALVGALLVAVGGLIACHTMWVAMKEAKAHGEAKKLAQQEARRLAREARKPGGSGGAGSASRREK